MKQWKRVLNCVSKDTKYPSVCENEWIGAVVVMEQLPVHKNICQVVTVLTLFVCLFVFGFWWNYFCTLILHILLLT
jgi:hypothetical protein